VTHISKLKDSVLLIRDNFIWLVIIVCKFYILIYYWFIQKTLPFRYFRNDHIITEYKMFMILFQQSKWTQVLNPWTDKESQTPTVEQDYGRGWMKI